MVRTELAELAAWAEARLPRLIDEACAAAVDRIPFYRESQIVSAEELRRSIEHNLRFLVTAIGNPQAPLDLAAPEATGRRRAHQGAPLPEVLQCYRICFTTLWDALTEHTRDGRNHKHDHSPAATDALLTAAGMIMRLTDQHALALTEAYRAATAELLLAKQQRRSALVEALLTGHPGPDAGPWEAAALLGLPSDGQLVVVAADTRGLAEASLPDVERRLGAHGIVSGWRLTPAQQLGVVSLHADQRDVMIAVLRESARARTGVSPPYRSLSGTPRALHLAQAALAGLPPGQAEVRTFNPSPLAALMVCEPDEGRRLADEVLGPVLGLPTEDRAPLLDTLNAYLEHAGSAERAAEVLYCHPNTVRYRLRRLQELTGRSLSDPHGIAELATAAYAVAGPSYATPRESTKPHAVQTRAIAKRTAQKRAVQSSLAPGTNLPKEPVPAPVAADTMTAMQISESPLAEAGRRYFSAADAETWIGLLRPAFHLRALIPGESVAAYLGGDPLLPKHIEWPRWEGHGPLSFVAALDCGEVPTHELDIPLPKSGALLFFYFDGLGDSTVAYTDPDSVIHGTRVIYVPADAEAAPRSAPEGTSPFPRLLLGGEMIATAPDNENAALIAAYGDPNDPVAYCDYPTTDADGNGFWDELTAFRRDHSPHHRIGGYALPVQGSVEPEGAQVFHPGTAERAEAARKELASQLVLLAQIDSDSRSGMGWGDAGRLYWMIRRDDLAAGRFDKATFTWQCE